MTLPEVVTLVLKRTGGGPMINRFRFLKGNRPNPEPTPKENKLKQLSRDRFSMTVADDLGSIASLLHPSLLAR